MSSGYLQIDDIKKPGYYFSFQVAKVQNKQGIDNPWDDRNWWLNNFSVEVVRVHQSYGAQSKTLQAIRYFGARSFRRMY